MMWRPAVSQARNVLFPVHSFVCLFVALLYTAATLALILLPLSGPLPQTPHSEGFLWSSA